jgi:hypothetical protein
MQIDTIPEDMLAAVDAGHKRCEAKLNTFANELEAAPPPNLIYHYTDGAGLLGILDSGKIRLTDVFGLNDPSEVLHGVKRAGEILTVKAQHAHPAAKVFAKKYSAALDLHLTNVAHFFVACFSLDGDELGQWRAYADNGNGFALGFDTGALERVYSTHKEGVLNATYPITYDDKLLCDICESFATELMTLIALPNARSLSNPVINEYMQRLSIALANSAFRAALYFKHEAYKSKREYRFLQVRAIDHPLEDLKYRATRHSLVRFTQFDWKEAHRETLREIVIGPAAPEQRARPFIDSCLALAGLDREKVLVRHSEIPYRN